jgi:hypothetical protein
LSLVEHGALAPTRAKCVETDMRGDTARPRPEAAQMGKRIPRQRKNDLFERLLDEVVVIRPPVSDDAMKRTVYDLEEAIVDLGSDSVVVTPHGVYECLVAEGDRFGAVAGAPSHQPKS